MAVKPRLVSKVDVLEENEELKRKLALAEKLIVDLGAVGPPLETRPLPPSISDSLNQLGYFSNTADEMASTASKTISTMSESIRQKIGQINELEQKLAASEKELNELRASQPPPTQGGPAFPLEIQESVNRLDNASDRVRVSRYIRQAQLDCRQQEHRVKVLEREVKDTREEQDNLDVALGKEKTLHESTKLELAEAQRNLANMSGDNAARIFERDAARSEMEAANKVITLLREDLRRVRSDHSTTCARRDELMSQVSVLQLSLDNARNDQISIRNQVCSILDLGDPMTLTSRDIGDKLKVVAADRQDLLRRIVGYGTLELELRKEIKELALKQALYKDKLEGEETAHKRTVQDHKLEQALRTEAQRAYTALLEKVNATFRELGYGIPVGSSPDASPFAHIGMEMRHRGDNTLRLQQALDKVNEELALLKTEAAAHKKREFEHLTAMQGERELSGILKRWNDAQERAFNGLFSNGLISEATLRNALAHKEFDMTTEPTRMQMVTETLKTDGGEALYRTGARQLVKLVRDPVAALLSRHLGPDDDALRGRVALFLQTEMGTALLTSVLSLAVSTLPSSDPRVARLARELRVSSMAGVGDVVASLLTGPLMTVLSTVIKDMPPEALTVVEPAGQIAAKAQVENTSDERVKVNIK